MKATYIYLDNPYERLTAPEFSQKHTGKLVRLSKAPSGGMKLNKMFRWIEDLEGNFLGMVSAKSLHKYRISKSAKR